MTAARPSDWAVSPHRAAAEADATQAAKEEARRELDTLHEALAHFHKRLRVFIAAGLKPEAAVVKRQIANTEDQIRERRAVLEGGKR